MKKRKRDKSEFDTEESENLENIDSEEYNYTLIHYAVINHQIDNLNLNDLLHKRINIDAIELDWHYTALHWAVHLGYGEAVDILIKHGAKLNIKDDEGDTPLHLASRNPNWNIFNKLIISRADIDAVNNESNTPLHLAVKHGHISYIKLLIKRGANIEAVTVNDKKETALSLAFRKYEKDENFKDIIKILIELGANVNINAATFLNLADQKNDIELIKLLISSGLQIHKSLDSFLYKNIDNKPKTELFRLSLVTDRLLGIDEEKLLTTGKKDDIEQFIEHLKLCLENLFSILKNQNINNDNNCNDPCYNIFSVIKDRIHATIFKLNKENSVTAQFKILHNNIKKIGLFDLYFDQGAGKIVEYSMQHDTISDSFTIADMICANYVPTLKSIIIDNIVSKVNLPSTYEDKDIHNFCLEFIKYQDDANIFIIPTDLHKNFFEALNKHWGPKVSSEAYKFIDQQTNFVDLSGQDPETQMDNS